MSLTRKKRQELAELLKKFNKTGAMIRVVDSDGYAVPTVTDSLILLEGQSDGFLLFRDLWWTEREEIHPQHLFKVSSFGVPDTFALDVKTGNNRFLQIQQIFPGLDILEYRALQDWRVYQKVHKKEIAQATRASLEYYQSVIGDIDAGILHD